MRRRRRRYTARHMRRPRRVMPVVIVALIITIIALCWLYAPDIAALIRGNDTQDTLQGLYRGMNSLLFPSAAAEEIQPEVSDEPVLVHEDFRELYEANRHLVGWLTAGPKIDYPVVQFDNSYYLDHDFFGNEDIAGTIFVNAANRLEPRDSILLIHGHNMRVGTMFGDLDSFREYKYVRKNPIVTFRMADDPEDVYYVPVAGFDASMNPDAEGYFDIRKVRFQFDIPAETENGAPRSTELEEYLAGFRANSYWNSPVEADSTDEYILLITCSYLHDDGRMLLLCRQLREGETPESVSALFSGK